MLGRRGGSPCNTDVYEVPRMHQVDPDDCRIAGGGRGREGGGRSRHGLTLYWTISSIGSTHKLNRQMAGLKMATPHCSKGSDGGMAYVLQKKKARQTGRHVLQTRDEKQLVLNTIVVGSKQISTELSVHFSTPTPIGLLRQLHGNTDHVLEAEPKTN